MPQTLSREVLWARLGEVMDPEVPVLSVVDLGIVRALRVDEHGVEVDITPTYSGCPAMQVIEHDIVAALEQAGADRVRVNVIYQPAWTTDWISADARERLRAYGIAPPKATARSEEAELIPLRRRAEPLPCPYCASRDTEVRSEFGATACKAICYCNACRQPFEHFKTI